MREMAIAAGSFIRSTDDCPFFVTIGYSNPHHAAVNYGNYRKRPGAPSVAFGLGQPREPILCIDTSASYSRHADHRAALNRELVPKYQPSGASGSCRYSPHADSSRTMCAASDNDDKAKTRSGPEEQAYLLGRADAHRRLGEQTTDTETRLVHVRLQQLYEDRAAAVDVVVPD